MNKKFNDREYKVTFNPLAINGGFFDFFYSKIQDEEDECYWGKNYSLDR